MSVQMQNKARAPVDMIVQLAETKSWPDCWPAALHLWSAEHPADCGRLLGDPQPNIVTLQPADRTMQSDKGIRASSKRQQARMRTALYKQLVKSPTKPKYASQWRSNDRGDFCSSSSARRKFLYIQKCGCLDFSRLQRTLYESTHCGMLESCHCLLTTFALSPLL